MLSVSCGYRVARETRRVVELIQKFDAKLEVTTSSLEALKEYALGRSEQDRGQFFKAIEFYKRATEIDPNFAVAWLGLGLQYSNTSQPGLGGGVFVEGVRAE